MNDKEKCHLINQMRLKVAEINGIDFTIEDCTLEGDCQKDCVKMASELEYLEKELEKKQNRGEKINLRGVFSMDYEGLPERPQPSVDDIRYHEKIEKLRQNPELANLPPRYLDNLLD